MPSVANARLQRTSCPQHHTLSWKEMGVHFHAAECSRYASLTETVEYSFCKNEHTSTR